MDIKLEERSYLDDKPYESINEINESIATKTINNDNAATNKKVQFSKYKELIKKAIPYVVFILIGFTISSWIPVSRWISSADQAPITAALKPTTLQTSTTPPRQVETSTATTQTTRRAFTDAFFGRHKFNKSKKIFIRHPIVFIPGMGGSKLEVKKDGGDWHLVWMNQQILLYDFDYFRRSLALRYDPVTDTSHNASGYQVRSKDFGTMDGTDYLDESLFSKIVDYFNFGKAEYSKAFTLGMINMGYTPDFDLVSASYDFRIATANQDIVLQKIVKLIEATFRRNNNRKVLLVCHSLGGLMAYRLLLGKSEKWKQKYIEVFVPINIPWMGSIRTLNVLTTGDNFGVKFINQDTFRRIVITWESMIEVIPRNMESKRVIVQTPLRNYTAKDVSDYLKMVDPGFATKLYKKVLEQYRNFSHPKVKVMSVMSSTNQPITTTKLIFTNQNDVPMGRSIIQVGKGDANVDHESLNYAYFRWSRNSKYGGLVKRYIIHGSKHTNIITDPRMFRLIWKLNNRHPPV